MTTSTQFVVARDDLKTCRLIETPLPEVTQLPETGLLDEGRALRLHSEQHHLRDCSGTK